MREDLLAALWCPDDHGSLRDEGDAASCTDCGRRYPVVDGVLSFLEGVELSDIDRREQQDRDHEAAWYDSIWPAYVDKVELAAHADPLGRPDGPVLDLGAGPGRVAEFLARQRGLSVVAVDYSLESLRLLVRRCEGLAVLAVHADGRALPLRDGAVAGAASSQCYEHLRPPDRHRLLREAARVLRPGARLAVSTFNYNLTFRLWAVRGNPGARQGEHMYGSDFYYVRQTPKEFRRELAAVFDDVDVAAIRHIPARSLGRLVGRVAGPATGDRFMGWMTRSGHRADRALEHTPLAFLTGFLLLGTVSCRPASGNPSPATRAEPDRSHHAGVHTPSP